ncbi:aminotransferase class I/II-fold pyridoxal phosphate-dependent enzyme [Collinsella tanakaei]|uniref:pyridoxal phosphate-dependent decarboxylase family protein n=1 Tax=Collinsella tanakaei TaxID=626935 RepID=UPI001956C941|nr:aminotransferase class I/II-fold pyridoxal phosphate-dependent enzyme [Collinsella tanakaei]MBM6755699.1 aminotransferase class I/II-fold pyridoxal phosphate-dependent enzyme [Collinsella tanakaei]
MYAKGMATEPDVELAAVRFVCELFARNRHLSEGPVAVEAPESTLEAIRAQGIPEHGRALDDVVAEMEHEVIGYGYNADHARFLGFVPGPTSAISWLGDIIAAGYNRHAGSFANYPAGLAAEDVLLAWCADQAGFPADTAGGLFVSGGSTANLTALAAARDAMLPEDAWDRGVAYVSEQTHSSVAKGLHIIGIPREHVHAVSCDDAWRMDIAALEDAIEADRAAGLIPFAVVGTAGSTNTGSVDPLREIARVCAENHLWMHVDGAFGASALITRYRDMLDGVELADSLSWDAHKWLFQTYSCGMVLVRDRANLLNTYSTHPEYLKDLQDRTDLVNPWDLGPELTRPARGLKLWFTLQAMGSAGLAEAVEHGFTLARWVEDECRKNPDIEIVSPAQMAMVNFRYAPAGLAEDELDELNLDISRRMLESGYAGVFTTELAGKKVLRVCAIHPEAKEEDMRGTVQHLNALYAEALETRRA